MIEEIKRGGKGENTAENWLEERGQTWPGVIDRLKRRAHDERTKCSERAEQSESGVGIDRWIGCRGILLWLCIGTTKTISTDK